MLFHIYRSFDYRREIIHKVTEQEQIPAQGPSTDPNEKESKTKEVTKTIAQGAKDVLGWVWGRGKDIWYGGKEAVFDTKQGEIDDIVKSCHEAGLNFTIENIESDQTNGPRYRVKVDIHNQSNDVSLDEETKKQRQDIKDRINANPTTDDNPEALNNMIARAAIKDMTNVLVAPRTEAEKRAQVALYTYFYNTQKNAVLEKGLVITPALLNNAFRSAGENATMYSIPQISTFKNLYKDGRGIITDEKFPSDNFSPLAESISQMARFGTDFVELDQKSVLRDFTEKIPEKIRDGFFNLHPVEKMIVIGAAVYFLFFHEKKSTFRSIALYGSLIWVGSKWFTGKNPAELLGWLGGNANKLYGELTTGSYANAMEKMMNLKENDPESTRRMQSIMVVGHMRLEDVVNNYDPVKGQFDESALTHEQKEFIRKFLKDEANNRGVAQDWDERIAISDMLNHFFFYVGKGDRKKGYEIICSQYLTKDADGKRWKIDTSKWGDKLTFFQVMVQSIDPADIKKTDAQGAALGLREKEFANKDRNEVTERFKRQGIDLKYLTRISHHTKEQETVDAYFLGGWQVELHLDGNKASLKLQDGATIQINDINAITQDEKTGANGIKSTIEAFANTNLGPKVGLKGIEYNVEKGEYTSIYRYNGEDWKVLFKPFGGNAFFATGTGKENHIETYTEYFDPSNGRSRALLVDRTISPEVQGYPLTTENIEAVISHTGNIKAINDSIGKLPYEIEWNNIKKNEKGGYTITISPTVILEADQHFEIFNFKGETATFQKNELAKKLGERLTSDDAAVLLSKKISNVYGTEAIFLKAEGEGNNRKEDRLFLKDFGIEIPITDMKIEGGVVTSIFGNKVDYENGRFDKGSEKGRGFKNTFLKPAIIQKYFNGDKNVEISELNGTKMTVRYSSQKGAYAPSILRIDVKDLEQQEGVADPALAKKMRELTYTLRIFEGYEIKAVDFHRTIPENKSQLTGVSVMIGSYENRDEKADLPTEAMLWKVDIEYDPSGNIKSYKVKQLLGSPNVEEFLDNPDAQKEQWSKKNVRELVNTANKELLDAINDGSGLDSDKLYDSFYDRDPTTNYLVKRKNELHGLAKNKAVKDQAKSKEATLDGNLTNIIASSDYSDLYNGSSPSFHSRYIKLLDATPSTPNSSVMTMRYLLLRGFTENGVADGIDFTTAYNDDIADRLTRISNITPKEAQYFMKYPAMVPIYVNLLLNSNRFAVRNIGPNWVSSMLDYVNDPNFADRVEGILGLFVYMDEKQVPFADQTEVQMKLIELSQNGTESDINNIISKVEKQVAEHTYYTDPTNWSKAYKLLQEGKDIVTRPLAIDK